MVGVCVGLDDAGDLQPLAPGQPDVVVNPLTSGVDHDGLAGSPAADEVRKTARLLVLELVEDHRDLRVYYRGIPGQREAPVGRVRVASVGDVPAGQGLVVQAGGRSLALFNVDGTFYAIDNTCLHR